MKKAYAGRLSLVVLAVSLSVFGFCRVPMTALAQEFLSATQRSEAQIDALVKPMLASGEYVEGEAIVCRLGEGAEGLTAQSGGLFEDTERLSGVTARQYAEATGEVLPVAGEPGAMTAQAEDEPVEILLVRSPNVLGLKRRKA